MMSLEGTLEQAQEILASLSGRHAWQVRRGEGSFLLLDFGAPSVHFGQPKQSRLELLGARGRLLRTTVIRGEFNLWLYQCDWIAHLDGGQVHSSTATDRDFSELTRILDGQILRHASIETDGSSAFAFDLGATIKVTPTESEVDQWMLFDYAATRVLTLRGDGEISVSRSDAPASEAQWCKPVRPVSSS